MKKIIKCLVLSLLLITILPIGVLADNSNAYAYSEDSSGKQTFYNSVQDAMNATRRGLTVIMNKDWEISSPIDIVEGTTSKLEMNGYRIKRTGTSDTTHTGEVFTLHPNSSLYLSGNLKKETSFTFKHGTYSLDPVYTITSGGLVTGGDTYNGGAIYMKKKSKLYLDNVALSGNTARNDGGAIFVNNEDCEIYMSNNAQISYNKAGDGGGIYSDADGTHIHMSNGAQIYKNHSSSDGGGIYFNYSWFTLDNEGGTTSIHDNSSHDSGGAIFVETKSKGSNNGRISGLDIYNNTSIGSGGALYLRQKNITIKNCTIRDNIAAKYGGGIYNANDNRIENTTITGNKCNYQKTNGTNYKGAGIYSARSNDITLAGKVIIKNNLRMNELEKNITDTYFIGHSGWRDDDIFLYTSNTWGVYAYAIADNVDPSSLIGLYTDVENKDRLLVKNLGSFTYGHTFFLDDATKLHVEYIANDNALWQRTGTTQYSLIINGVEREKIDFRGTSATYDANKSTVLFDYWEAEGIDLTDEQKHNAQICIKSMPARDVILTAHYSTTKETEDITLTVNAPTVGALLPTTGIFSWIDNTSGKDVVRQMEIPVSWKVQTSEVSGIAQDKDYKVYAEVKSDTSKNLLFGGNSKNIKIVYQTGTSQEVTTCSPTFVEQGNWTIGITGGEISALKTKYSVKNYSQKLDVGVGESLSVFLDELPKTVNAVATNGNTVTLDLEAPSEDQYAKFIKDGVVTKGSAKSYTVKLKIKNPNNLNINKKEISVKVSFVEQKSKVISIPEVNIDFADGGSCVNMMQMIENKIIDAVAVDKDGKQFNCKLKIKGNINYINFEYPLRVRGIVSSSLKVDFTVRRLPDDQDNTYVYYADVEVQDGDKSTLRLGEDTKVKVVFNIVKKADGSSSPKLKVVKLNDTQNYSFEDKAVVDYEDEVNNEVVQDTTNEIVIEDSQEVTNGFDDEFTLDEENDQANLDNEEVTNQDDEIQDEFDNQLDEDIELYNVDEEVDKVELIFEIENYDDLVRDYTNVYYSVDDGKSNTCSSRYIPLSGSKNDTAIHTLKVWASNGDVSSEETAYYYSFYENDLTAPSVNLDSGEYTANDTENTTYDSETGDLTLNVPITNTVDGATIHYLYSKYGDTYGDWIEGNTSEVNLTASAGETVTYKVIVWVEKDGEESDYVEREYTLDNSTNYRKVTINSTSPDGSLNESQILYYEKGTSFNLALPQYANYCLTDSSSIQKYTNITENNSDRYLLSVSDFNLDIVLNIEYTALITALDFDIDNLTIGKELPTVKGITGILTDGETTINLSKHFDLNNVSWQANSTDVNSTEKVDYITKYKASLGIVNTTGKDSEYLFISTPNSNLSDRAFVFVTQESGSNDHIDHLSITFNKTIDKLSDDKIEYTLSGLGSISYDDLTYEDALSFENVREGSTLLDNYNVPNKVSAKYTDGSDTLNIIWNNTFTKGFDPNNYDAQELVLEGHVNIPSYVNSNGISNKITLRIKVKAKQGYVPEEVIEESSNKAVTCEEYMKSKDWTWSETKKACVYKVSNTKAQ